jgi:hypothetical protein
MGKSWEITMMGSKEPLETEKQICSPQSGEADTFPPSDDLAAIKGIVFTSALSIPLWAILGAIAWVVWH